jgi:hypothetical protein
MTSETDISNVSQTKFKTVLSNKGICNKRGNAGLFYLGIKVKKEDKEEIF